jgi:hypothetical protein
MMSDVMLIGVLRMPMPDEPDPMTLRQFVSRARQAADRIEADGAEIERLRAALTLAANRMDVLALDHDYGTTRRNIADDWAKETRAALGPNV